MGKLVTIEKHEISKLSLSITDFGWRDITNDDLFSKIVLALIKERQEYILGDVDFDSVEVEVDFVPYRVSGKWLSEYTDPRVVACDIPLEWE